MADLREGQGAARPDSAYGQFTVLDARHGEFAETGTPPGFTPLRDIVNEPDTQSVQGEVEGAPALDDTNSIEFMGERFRLAANIGLMPLLRFANASKRGLDSDDFEGMAAMYAMIRGIIHRPPLVEPDRIETDDDETGGRTWVPNPIAGEPKRDENGKRLRDETEWNRFVEHAEDEGAEGDDLMKLVGAAMGVIAARPQQRPSVSSAPSPSTSPSSREFSSSPDTPVRPDLADLAHLTPVASLGRSM